MLPVIALVGRPNVGKSTLFNRLTRSRDALVANQPGLTRDRKYGIGKLGNRPYLVIDTGGLLLGDEDHFVPLIRTQAEQAILDGEVTGLDVLASVRAATGTEAPAAVITAV